MTATPKKVRAPDLALMKERGERIVMLSAYDATMARLFDRAGVDLLLVGDSLGHVILHDALAIEDAGAFAIVLEAIPDEVVEAVTARLRIPTIGIGAGPHCDGQVLVSYDLLGLFDSFVPPFVKQYAQLGDAILDAAENFASDVRQGLYPRPERAPRESVQVPAIQGLCRDSTRGRLYEDTFEPTQPDNDSERSLIDDH
ncbi:MAG TPA: 3-methyl-2-oxobutanoate hydroxymethyltransferase [Pirellulales bacterium]|nr:3-methyl-2-oxobutanoate hydroxymethyltransferase [Pirellulales bacterium]